jgi:flagellar protein FlbD
LTTWAILLSPCFIHIACHLDLGGGVALAQRSSAMIKLTRLHNQIVVINPDHIYEAEATPDTTLRLANGERIIVKETLDEFIEKVIAYRKRIHDVPGVEGGHDGVAVAAMTGCHGGDEDGAGRTRGGF